VYQTRLPVLFKLNLFCLSHWSVNLTMNGLWYVYLCIVLSNPHLSDGFMLHIPRLLGVTEVSGFRSLLLVTHECVDPCQGLCFRHYVKRKKSQ